MTTSSNTTYAEQYWPRVEESGTTPEMSQWKPAGAHASLRHSQCKKIHSFTKHEINQKTGNTCSYSLFFFPLFNRMKQRSCSFIHAILCNNLQCVCMFELQCVTPGQVELCAVDNCHWRRQCVGGCVGEDDYQMRLCGEKKKKKKPSCQKSCFTLLDYTEVSVTWIENVQTVSVDPDWKYIF